MEPRSSPRWPAQKPTHHKSEDEDKREPAFICTICWRPQHSPSKPKLLGSSARIVCKLCWRSVLDLSICWVCGEYIVRGDEVVSLGWCFWHNACFGCLICRTKMSVPHVEEGEKNGGMGVELNEIPLCTVCKVEMSGESPSTVLDRGLENVSRFDGGLSRERLQRWSEISNEDEEDTQSRSLVIHRDGVRESPRCSQGQQRPNTSTHNRHSLLHSTRILGDASADGPRYEDASLEPMQVIQDRDMSNAYVSIFDPIGEPAFEPSKTKPLPKWMYLLPNNIHRDREQQSIDNEAQFPEKTLKQGKVPLFQPENDHLDDQGSATPTKAESHGDTPTPPMDIPNAHARVGSKIIFRPHPEIESAGGGQREIRRSHTLESTYLTPPEYPRKRTPFPGQGRPSVTRRGTSSYFAHLPGESSIKEPLVKGDICCELGSPLLTPTPEHSSPEQLESLPTFRPLVPSQSSEYLERYRPKSAANNHERYVAKDPEPVMNKLKRQRLGRQTLEQVAEERSMKRRGGGRARSPRLSNEVFGLDPRRKDLNRELRNLFREE